MSKLIPEIQKYMTISPRSIDNDETLEAAHKTMFEHQIRHLPVMRENKLVGVVTQRDLALLETLTEIEPRLTKVNYAMSSAVYAVSPTAPLDQVAMMMAAHKYGCCVVMQNEKVVGIFTMVDACRALSELLHGRLAA